MTRNPHPDRLVTAVVAAAYLALLAALLYINLPT